MGRLARFGVSLDEELLEPFDALRKTRQYATRSEAIRDLIRGALNQASWGSSDVACATLTLIYDHHRYDLARRLSDIQHGDHDLVIATLHVHIDPRNCMEILALSGEPDRVRSLADRLVSCRGVKYGIFNPVPNGGDLV